MKATTLCSFLFLMSAISASSQNPTDGSIAVSFSIDGNPARCDGFAVELRFEGESFKPKQNGLRFQVPDIFAVRASDWSDNEPVEIALTCDRHTIVFPNQNPAFLRVGGWQFGIAQPLYAVREYAYTHEFDHGAWLGYLIFDGEPEVQTFSSQPDPLPGIYDTLRQEQPNATLPRARDIAYVLAIWNEQYQRNRDYLVSVLNDCLARQKESPEGDVCSGDLLKFLTNLYWRGDTSLLSPLLRIAESRQDVIDDIGTFYADLLERRGEEALIAMKGLPEAKQQLISKLADEDDFKIDSPKRERTISLLRKSNTEAANQCLKALGQNR